MKLNKTSPSHSPSHSPSLNRQQVDFNKLNVFCQVIESGNYQRASEALHVTPSALSQAITGLEHSLGLALFERHGKRLRPSENGLRLHREFRSRQQGFFEILEEIQGVRNQVHGLLRIGAYLEFAKTRLTSVIRSFTHENPNADVKLAFDSPSRLHSLIQQGQLDLCFSIFPSPEKKSIRSTALIEEELVFIASPRLLSHTPDFEEILSAPLIDYYFNHQLLKRWLALHFAKRVKKIPVRIFAATAEMVVALAKEGAGVGVVPRYLVHDDLGDDTRGELRIIRPTARRLSDYIWLLERENTPLRPVHQVFRKMVFSQFEIQR
jgi:LysR family positive regulator for ilvC